jgi:opacity protein-like surface antigen
MRFFKRFALLVLFSVSGGLLFAQKGTDDCEQTLNYAAAEYNAGRFYNIASILKPCMDNGFSREQRQRANLLLTQTYLIQDNPVEAENSYLNMLRANPEFLADTAREPIDVVYLSRKFTADPIFSAFVKIGGNTSPVRVIYTVNPSGETTVDNAYRLRAGWQIGGGFDFNFRPDMAITAEFNYAVTSYSKQQIKFNLDNLVFTDRQNWVMLPISFKYADTKGVLRPYGYAGFSLQWLFSDKGQISWTKNDENPVEGQPLISNAIESPTLDFIEFRNKFNTAFFFGGGVRYKLGLDFVFADLRYSFGLTNLVIPSSTFASTGPMVEYSHADDYFRLDNLAISVGYVKPFYKPRKIKRARTQSILRGINKSST